ncbi:VOC family protein [Streptosporangium saharense]|uniref:Catechol 2,3-dioxygenase-like lactoylglutathione lyase family enzyme n=1 Tax=Streptosporangium saharense TaxID=1706840 RepID=A0A7W7VKK0_9ACTN|nr:VOC family protein [Streptosporangium saharense]MBB4913424.1 catechol 2,3-dioxygenase-like lactoylglutathione lyase family enzyme [Streptosporangium saharense]
MALTLSHVFLEVRDQDEAVAFYRDVLGLRVNSDVVIEGYRWLTLTTPSQPDVEIVLNQVGMVHPTDREQLEALLAKGVLNGVFFKADDVDATFEKIRESGVEVLQEPIDQPYGVRDCAFRDPSGNMIRFSGPKRSR